MEIQLKERLFIPGQIVDVRKLKNGCVIAKIDFGELTVPVRANLEFFEGNDKFVMFVMMLHKVWNESEKEEFEQLEVPTTEIPGKKHTWSQKLRFAIMSLWKFDSRGMTREEFYEWKMGQLLTQVNDERI